MSQRSRIATLTLLVVVGCNAHRSRNPDSLRPCPPNDGQCPSGTTCVVRASTCGCQQTHGIVANGSAFCASDDQLLNLWTQEGRGFYFSGKWQPISRATLPSPLPSNTKPLAAPGTCVWDYDCSGDSYCACPLESNAVGKCVKDLDARRADLKAPACQSPDGIGRVP
jgi:hypothetical protein